MATLHDGIISTSRAVASGPTDFCDSVSEIPRAECEALVALYASTDGPHWGRSTGWLETTTPCSWHGVTCSGGHVTALELVHNQLGGSIPPELGDLKHLEYLSLASNALSGSIPTELGKLTHLTMLILCDNRLSGSIPPELGKLAKLTHLRLYTNQLSGSIPPDLGNLASLTYLVLKSNQLSGSIPPELGKLTNLNVLYLSYNQLSGEVPDTIVNLGHLQLCDLGYNMLTASDPEVIAFLNDKDPDWAQTQTVPPADVHVVNVSSSNVKLAWTPIAYTGDGGYYEVSYATSRGGPYTVHGTTTDKATGSYLATDLPPCPPYYFVVRTYTPAHESPGQYMYQQSKLWSEYSHEVPTPVLLFLPLVMQDSS